MSIGSCIYRNVSSYREGREGKVMHSIQISTQLSVRPPEGSIDVITHSWHNGPIDTRLVLFPAQIVAFLVLHFQITWSIRYITDLLEINLQSGCQTGGAVQYNLCFFSPPVNWKLFPFCHLWGSSDLLNAPQGNEERGGFWGSLEPRYTDTKYKKSLLSIGKMYKCINPSLSWVKKSNTWE